MVHSKIAKQTPVISQIDGFMVFLAFSSFSEHWEWIHLILCTIG